VNKDNSICDKQDVDVVCPTIIRAGQTETGDCTVSVTADQPAPYAPASAVLDLVTRHRNKGLQSPVDSDVLARSGISDSLIPRTLQALRALDLLTEDGRPSEVLEGIRLAPESEYKQRLTDWLTAAYADALAYVDPATDDETAIRDAFRKYTPTGQQARMVTLFIGLFTAAGVMPERAKQVPARKLSDGSTIKPSPKLRVVMKAKPMPREQPKPLQTTPSGLPPALSGLLASLPADGVGWTQVRRDKFVTTFEAVIDFCFPIVSDAVAAALNTDTATDE
jgi:hypothetical protein